MTACESLTVYTPRGRAVLIEAIDLPIWQGRRWEVDHKGYVTASFWCKETKRHRLARLHREIAGAAPKQLIDHRNGDLCDCRRANLRECSHAQNMRNAKRRADSRWPYKGVFLRPKSRWGARIKFERRLISLGSHDTAEAAARAYDEAARRLHGEFARVNFPS